MPELLSDVQVLIEEQAIHQRVAGLGARLSRDLSGLFPVFIAALKGAAIFHADLVRCVDLMLKIDFVTISSYGAGTESSHRVELVQDLGLDIENEHVILVEDIVDTGVSLSFLMRHLMGRNPASLRVCSLLSKPSRREVEVPIDYLGFEVPDEFIVGYGLDYSERYRNLPYLGMIGAAP